MNFPLLDRIADVQRGLLATILNTEGHTYKKKGEKALFIVDDPIPVYGNLGALCVDQAILIKGKEAVRERKPKAVVIDTRELDDIHFGYGTYCGGSMEILLEPVFDKHKSVYRALGKALERGESLYLKHDLDTGDLATSTTKPEATRNEYIERIPALTRLYIFGATPLAHCIVALVKDMAFELHIVDWRSAYLEGWEETPYVKCHRDLCSFDPGSFVLIVSHSFERDKEALKLAMRSECPYIGLLSSRKRRDRMYAELADEKHRPQDLERISSPVGIEIGGRSDPEIAVSIVAELVRMKNR